MCRLFCVGAVCIWRHHRFAFTMWLLHKWYAFMRNTMDAPCTINKFIWLETKWKYVSGHCVLTVTADLTLSFTRPNQECFELIFFLLFIRRINRTVTILHACARKMDLWNEEDEEEKENDETKRSKRWMENNAIDERVQIKRYCNEKLTKKKADKDARTERERRVERERERE